MRVAHTGPFLVHFSVSGSTFKVHGISDSQVISLTSVFESQLNNPEMVEGLVLINVNPCAEGWMDWAASKISGWTQALPDMVISHLFGKVSSMACHSVIMLRDTCCPAGRAS